MKILLFAASFPPPKCGGSVEYLYNIVYNLPRDSVVVHTANLYPIEAQEFDRTFPQRIVRSNFILHVLGAYYTGHNLLRILIRKLICLREYILWPLVGFWLIIRERPDVICIGEQNYAAVSAWFAYRLLGIPYLYFTYAEELTMIEKRPIHKLIHLAMIRRAQVVVTVCEYTRDLLVRKGVVAGRIVKIVPAVGQQKKWVATPEQLVFVNQKYNLAAHHRILLTVGTLDPRKGHATVLEALPLVSVRFPDLRYIIAGSGPGESALKQQVSESGLAAQVVFTGRVDELELACLYEICDVFVLPHRQTADTLNTEGCPTVFLEASAHGKPVIGGNAGGVTDAIQDGRTGFIIDGTDKTLLANTICELLAKPDMAGKIGRAGQEYVSNLTPEKNAAHVWQICQEMHKDRKKT